MAGAVEPPDDIALATIFRAVNSIAVVGFSASPARPSNRVTRFLLRHGFDVYLVNPGLAGRVLLGRRVYPDLASLPVPIDMVDVFRHPDFLPGVVAEAIGIGAGLVWTQLDVVNASAEALAAEHNMPMVVDRCPAIEIPRLQAAGLL
jgi:predicted CoA-binding protein